MRKIIGISSIFLGVTVSSAAAEEQWQPIQRLDAPRAVKASSPAEPAPGRAAVGRLGKPVSAPSHDERPVACPADATHQAGYAPGTTTARPSGRVIVRGQEPEEILTPPRVVDKVLSAQPVYIQPAPGMIVDPCVPCDLCCPDGGPHGPWGCWYGSAEYLMWWTKDAETPPLITTSPQESFGILGEPGTRILFGGDIDSGRALGGRFTLGKWFDPCQQCGIEGSFFFLANRTESFDAASPGDPLLARPFFNALDGFEDAQLVANLAPPGLFPLSGSVNVRLENELLGAEINLRKNLAFGLTPRHCLEYHVDGLVGFRYLRFEEKLSIAENLSVPLDSTVLGGSSLVVSDRFSAENNFFGGQIGLDAELRKGRWFLNVRPKLAIGVVRQSVSIAGATQFSGPNVPTTIEQGGLYALSSNIGDYDRNRFSLVPEIGITLGYQLTDHLRVFVGYNLLYWFNVARPGEQIDRAVNPTLLPSAGVPFTGPARPTLQFNDSSFWAQGFTFGLELRY